MKKIIIKKDVTGKCRLCTFPLQHELAKGQEGQSVAIINTNPSADCLFKCLTVGSLCIFKK